MAIAVDASTPARVDKSTAGTAAATAAFNPPSNSIIVAVGWTGDNGTAENNTMAMSNNGAATTWTLIGRRREAADVTPQDGWVEAWYTPLVASRVGMTITGTLNVSYRWCFKVYVITGGDLGDCIGAYVEGSSTAVSLTTSSIVQELANSLVMGACNDWAIASGATTTQPVSSDLTEDIGHIATNVAGFSGYKAGGAAASSQNYNISTTGSAPKWNYLVWEVRAAAATPSAVRFTTGTDYYTNTASVPNATYTVTCWANVRVDRNNFSGIWAISGSGSSSANDTTIETDADGVTAKLWANSGFSTVGQVMTVGTWYRFAVTKSGTTSTMYYGPATGGLSTTTRTVGATLTVGEVCIGALRITSEFFNGSVAAFKVWNGVALSPAEIDAEFTQYDPVRAANLQRYYSFANGPQTNDQSGNGFTLTQGAAAPTLDSSGPPIPLIVTTTPTDVSQQLQPYTARRRATLW